MSRLPPLPDLDWRDPAAPVSRDVGDVYFSGDGLAEKRAVFLDGCGLPDAWAGREVFTIGELGFGAGVTLVALWELWRRTRPSPRARLHVVSFERALMSAGDQARIASGWPGGEAELAARLRALWPDRQRGVQRVELGDGVSLTLHLDEIEIALPRSEGRMDAWFLDGFSPARNPAMWSAATLAEVARLSAPGARAATYTVAGEVRRGLAAAGFRVERRPGHGRKKERLEAAFVGEAGDVAARLRPVGSAVVVGAGVAGATAAAALAARGVRVTVIEAEGAPGAAASGNPLALVTPRHDLGDGPEARALLAAEALARRVWGALPAPAATRLDIAQTPRDARQAARFARLLADPPVDATRLAPLDPARPEAGVAHLGAFALRPDLALPSLLAGAEVRRGQASAIGRGADGRPELRLATGERLAADAAILAAGMGLGALLHADAPPLAGRLGQLEWAECDAGAPLARADGGYVAEAGGRLVFGATFEPAPGGDPPVTAAARAHNLQVLERLAPDRLAELDPGKLRSRAAVRATTPDRLPVCGPVYGSADDVWLIGGLGSRGWLWAPLLAEIAASALLGEPPPIDREALARLSPARFAPRR